MEIFSSNKKKKWDKMSSRKELAGVRIDICSLREALHRIEHYVASEGMHAVETVSMKTILTAGENDCVRQCLEDMELVIPSDKEILMELGVTSRQWLDEAREHRFAYEALRTIARGRNSIYLLTQDRSQMDMLCQYLEDSFGDNSCVCGDAVWEECEGDTERIVNEINAVAPHLLLVMLPTPVQETFLAEHRKMLNVRLWFGIGTENTFAGKANRPGGVLRKVLAHRKMKRQIQSSKEEHIL